MSKSSYLFDKVSEMKLKFKNFRCHTKKLRALENFSKTASFPHWSYLPLVRKCLQSGFLDDKEAEFLDHMLNKCQINFLDWEQKTKWVKAQMTNSRPKLAVPLATQMVFNFDKRQKQIASKIPSYLLEQQKLKGIHA